MPADAHWVHERNKCEAWTDGFPNLGSAARDLTKNPSVNGIGLPEGRSIDSIVLR